MKKSTVDKGGSKKSMDPKEVPGFSDMDRQKAKTESLSRVVEGLTRNLNACLYENEVAEASELDSVSAFSAHEKAPKGPLKDLSKSIQANKTGSDEGSKPLIPDKFRASRVASMLPKKRSF